MNPIPYPPLVSTPNPRNAEPVLRRMADSYPAVAAELTRLDNNEAAKILSALLSESPVDEDLSDDALDSLATTLAEACADMVGLTADEMVAQATLSPEESDRFDAMCATLSRAEHV